MIHCERAAPGGVLRPHPGLDPVRACLAVERAVNEYPKTRPDFRFWTRDGTFLGVSLEDFRWLVTTGVNRTSKPGAPWVYLGCKNLPDTVARYEETIWLMVNDRIRRRISAERQGLTLTAWQCFDLGLRDLVRVFVKNEPHTSKKVAEGRLRLIMNTGLVDILVSRVVMESLAEAEIAVWDTIPSKPGMGLDDRSIALLETDVCPELGRWQSSDVSGYDWALYEDLFLMSAEVERRQFRVENDSDLACALRMSGRLAVRKVFVLPDGDVLEQAAAFAQESGSRETAFRNSKIRVLLGYMAGATAVEAMGDDAKEKWHGPVDIQAYGALGLTVEVAEVPDGALFEFCSHVFYPGRAEPTSWAKTLFRLLSHAPSAELWRAFQSDMRSSPHLPRITAFLRGTAWGVVMA